MRCGTLTVEGQPCANWPLPGDIRCGYHTERVDVAESRHSQARHASSVRHNGGQIVGPAMLGDQTLDEIAGDLKTAVGVRDLLAATMQGVARGTVDVRVARVIGNLAAAQARIIETGDLEERLAVIEAEQAKKAA